MTVVDISSVSRVLGEERFYVVSMRVCVDRRTELRPVPIERTSKVRLDIVRVGDEGL